jgi:signal transduction histidine kinase
MWLAASATVFAWLTGGACVLIAAHLESKESYDEQLMDVAGVILGFASHEIEEIFAEGRTEPIHVETAATLDPRYAYQVWSKDRRLLLRSHDAPTDPFVLLGTSGRFDREIGGKPFCVYALSSADGSMLIQVAEDESKRGFLTPSLDILLVVLFLVSTGLLLLFNRWLFGRAMRALDESAEQLMDRSPQNLRPVQTEDPPIELQPLLKSVNALFSRIERTLDSERHFTAAAAHELRTPLAAVRMQAQVAERARSAQEAGVALRALVACVDRASRMVDQLLTLAHVESITTHPSTFGPVRIDVVVQLVVKDLEHVLAAQNVNVELNLEPATVLAIEFGIAALVRNLIDNAARHASAGGRVVISTAAADGEVTLTVDDAGPGIPEEERGRVYERFYRLPDSESTDAESACQRPVLPMSTARGASTPRRSVVCVTATFPSARRRPSLGVRRQRGPISCFLLDPAWPNEIGEIERCVRDWSPASY